MTAQLVATASRNPVKFGPGNYDELVVSTLGSADERTLWGLLRPAGQLWERVAETPSNAPAPLTARQDEGIVRAYAARDIRAHGGTGAVPVRGVAISGIIRAGERVK